MKVTGTGNVGQTSGARPGRAAGGDAFRLPAAGGASGPSAAAGVTGPSGVVGLEALIALQDVGSPLERRRRSVARASRILDGLEDLKLALLAGELTAHQLDQLGRAVREERSATDDPKLEALLDEIETRAAVELAKLERKPSAA
jgi:hypothetical protein